MRAITISVLITVITNIMHIAKIVAITIMILSNNNQNSSDKNSDDDRDNDHIKYDDINTANAHDFAIAIARTPITISMAPVITITLPNSPEGSFQCEPIENNAHT